MLNQRLSQKLLQKLSPQQIQLMKLLQVPTANLEQRIKEELEIKCKSWNKSRSPGEKSYYKLKYSIVPLVKSKVKEK